MYEHQGTLELRISPLSTVFNISRTTSILCGERAKLPCRKPLVEQDAIGASPNMIAVKELKMLLR